ncbi:hypothetical protein [Saccharomonospora sp. NB11]|jgi:hypothetical protein|uniref:hypothetical protein n=1 Tax=Saccharomonospora sp. NB11 TaxID=1642298 RepID=UPI0018D0F3F4|nr:hypothetical protein [Saccharomonospora sp. NB11]
MTGFHVDLDALYRYSQALASHRSAVNTVRDQVDQADVGDESWGIVGLFVKQDYTNMLGDLKDLLSEMEEGLQSASYKVRTAAMHYRVAEDRHRATLQRIASEMAQATIKTVSV